MAQAGTWNMPDNVALFGLLIIAILSLIAIIAIIREG